MKTLLVFFLLAGLTFCKAQTFDARSEKVSLNIRDWKKDKSQPVIVVYDLETLPGFPVYTRDSMLTVTGRVEDLESGVVSFEVNGTQPERSPEGKFIVRIPLHRGRNQIQVDAVDRNKNKSSQTYLIVQDPKADVAPPDIQLIEPPEQRGYRRIPVRDTLHLRAAVTDESGLLKVLINNERVMPDSAGQYVKDFVRIPDTVTIVALDTCGHLRTKSFATIRADSLREDLPDPGRYHALIFAVEKYRDKAIGDLYHPVKDATELAKSLVNNYTFDPKNVRLVQNPTRKDLLNALQNVRNDVTDKDNLLIFYAGHGVRDDEMRQGYWLPSDANAPPDDSQWINTGEIRDRVRAIKAKRILLVVDACFGGAIFQKRSVQMPMPTALKDILKWKVRKAMTSGALKEVPDRSDFVNYLLKRLNQSFEPYLRASDLFEYVKGSMERNGGTSPVYDPINDADDEGFGDFIFIHK